ncbi:MAG: hypothetical protein EA340_11960 [Nitriliruptor sp.]|nr:MAG: hypothetical protein EA340_11960 [Nitriliruptor sp.]
MSRPRTVLLGQFVDENADAILPKLEEAGIDHWAKRSGGLVRLLSAADWGTRIFVDADRLEEAKRIAATVTDG